MIYGDAQQIARFPSEELYVRCRFFRIHHSFDRLSTSLNQILEDVFFEGTLDGNLDNSRTGIMSLKSHQGGEVETVKSYE